MDFRVPALGEGVYEAELVEWRVQPGDCIAPGQPLAEVMTDKAVMELPAPFAGTIERLSVSAGQKVEVGQMLLQYAPDTHAIARGGRGDASTTELVRRRAAGATATEVRRGTRRDPAHRSRHVVPAAPVVRRLAKALGIDLREVPASGPAGRVLIDDLGAFLRTWQQPPPGASTRPRRGAAADLGVPGQRIKLVGLRRAIARHMVTAKQTIPHYSYIDECNVTELVALRNELKRPLYAEQVKLTSLPFYVKAVVAALKRVPMVNASLDESTGEIVLHDVYHIGIATATSRGLVVPVIRDADRRELADIAREIERLIRGAQAGRLTRDELRGSTFTISSVGNIGGLISTPIIHHPEVGIVAIGKVFRRPVFSDTGDVVPAHMVYLSFSFDHRVVDGSVGAIFGNTVIEHLEHPRRLLAC
ncbi:MAG: 2-oxo acid dehydrogenase subunit E2 [Pirellulaceae bacterium]|jgi:pyruvate dehydrogenase E2 component (dihydrolipoamide acetyltransferase)/2-oxoisovalerate dehydrogenase E2 component (dihydrolipoyl transacylase)|nr:2-oxo acid dehydrogenase subunit E2 [Pirellulaceae bacterium]